MSITGTGKIARKYLSHFVNVGTTASPEWEQIGEGIENLTREMNNNVETKVDIMGNNEVTLTKGNQTSSFSPYKAKKESKLFQKLYQIYTDDLELSDVEMEFLEVSVFDEVSTGTYSAIKQKGVVNLKSIGGDTSGLDLPFDVNFTGAKTKGNFAVATKTFTAAASV